MKNDGGIMLTGENRNARTKTCSSATLSTTNPTCINPGPNPGLAVRSQQLPPEPWHGPSIYCIKNMSVGQSVDDYFLLRDFGPCGTLLMRVVITVAMVMLLTL
jgi:hypothetical protein